MDPVSEANRTTVKRLERDAGFTLFEVLVALAILGIATAAVIQLLAGSLRLSGRVAESSVALLEAERRVNESLASDDLAVGTDGGRDWGREVSRVDRRESSALSTYRIRVWAREGSQQVELVTLRTVVPPR